jgi:hypothetical protein
MPRGSKPGERRGGRQRATPNKRTVLKERILSIASAYPTASDDEIVAYLIKDPMLPTSLRLAVARKWHTDAGLRSSNLRSSKRSSKTPKAIEAAVLTSASRTTSEVASKEISAADADSSVDRAVLPVLFGIVRDRAAKPKEQRLAALALTQYFLPKKTFVKKPRQELVADECGFVIEPDVARELRDLKLELDYLRRSSKKRRPHIVARKSAQLQKRIKEIQQSLACPCPSKYRLRRHFPDGPVNEIIQDGEIVEDKVRIDRFRKRRAQKQIFTPEEDLEEAIRIARYDSFLHGHEMKGRERLATLRDKERAAKRGYGPPLSEAQKALARALALFSPLPHREIGPDLDYDPLELPVVDDGGPAPLEPKQPPPPTPPSVTDDDFEEFGACPPFCDVDREVSEKKGRTVLKWWYENPNSPD